MNILIIVDTTPQSEYSNHCGHNSLQWVF